jgi:hypothetical protein
MEYFTALSRIIVSGRMVRKSRFGREFEVVVYLSGGPRKPRETSVRIYIT